MQNRTVTAQVIDFNSYKSSNSPVANIQVQPAYMPVVFYYPVYYVIQPLQAVVEVQPEEPKKYENNVVSIYDYLGEI